MLRLRGIEKQNEDIVKLEVSTFNLGAERKEQYTFKDHRMSKSKFVDLSSHISAESYYVN